MIESPVRRAFLWYTAAAFCALAAAGWVLQLWRADLRIPLTSANDARFTALCVKGLLEHGWYLDNDRVGAPGGLNLADFPMSDNLHFLLLKLVGLAVRDVGRTINLYYLLTFPLTALATLFVLRRLGVSYPPAFVAAELFTALPYHFFRGEVHLMLASYYLVPFAVLVAVWLYLGEAVLLRREERGWRLALSSRKSLAAVAVCLLLSAGGVYYAFFTCALLATAALAAALRLRAWQPLLAGGLLVGLIVGGTLANLAPTLLYHLAHGPNRAVAHTEREGAEIYGLKVTQLVLPITGHRVPLLATIKARYNRAAPLVNENDCASLGVIGSVGFVVLLLRAVLRRRLAPKLPDALGVLNLAAVLLGTVGGFGALFSFFLLPPIRGYNRLSVFIAFFALALVAWGMDRLAARWAGSSWGRRAVYGLLGLLLALGLFDQTIPAHAPDHAALQASFAQDAAFVASIEARLPPGASVMQLPYVPFPESPPVHDMQDYDHLRAYLHSHSLRWSYGAVKGRATDEWQQRATSQPPAELVTTLEQAGFAGLYLNRVGFADGGESLVKSLQGAGLGEPIRSSDGRLLFFDLADYTRHLHAALADDVAGEGVPGHAR
jgi:phosphoglycerol transferase